jgi:beta-lactamase superfamily II metal-dependent hydrolase
MFSFTLFDVGHGFCAYATTPGGANILFDCGYDIDLQFYPSTYFADRGITSISDLVLSHFDQDHICDLPALRRDITFGRITRNPTVPGNFIRRTKSENGVITAAMESALDMHEKWIHPPTTEPNYGGVKVSFFNNAYSSFEDTNNLSLVTFLKYGGLGIVIPGDLECAGWEALLEKPAFCQCLQETTVFIASHHGRNKGYCEEVFEYCKPQVILLSDKNILHDSQEHDYTKHASGMSWGNHTRRVFTTRNDGHMRITKEADGPSEMDINVTL